MVSVTPAAAPITADTPTWIVTGLLASAPLTIDRNPAPLPANVTPPEPKAWTLPSVIAPELIVVPPE
jgi:hypothetical protein